MNGAWTWLWWHMRFFGHALLLRDFEDPRVQRLVRERFGRANQ